MGVRTFVCVDASNPAPVEVIPNWVKQDETYTLRRSQMGPNGELGYLFNEITNPPIYMALVEGKAEPGFAARRFREVLSEAKAVKLSKVVELELEAA